MEGRLRELVEVADVVVVQMGDDHVAHLARVDAEQLQAFHRRAEALALAAASAASALKPVSITTVRAALRASHTK